MYPPCIPHTRTYTHNYMDTHTYMPTWTHTYTYALTHTDTGLPVIPPPIIRPPSTAGFSIHQDESFSGIGPVETLLPVSTSLPTHVLASRDHPLGVDASQHVDGGMGVFPTRVIASSTPGPQPTTAHLVNSFSSSIDGVTLTVTNLDLEVRTTTHYLGPSTTQQSGHQSTVKTLAVSKKVPAVTRLELNSGVLQTPLPSSLTVVVPAFNPPDLPDIGLVPPTIKGLDNGVCVLEQLFSNNNYENA